MSSKKAPPVIPVVGSGQGGDQSREDQLREWEDAQRQARENQTAAAPPALPVPAQTSSPAVDPPAVLDRVPVAGYLPMPEFTQPDSNDPQERLDFYSQGILAVQYAARANHERADQQRLIGLGLRLRAVKQEELHKSAGFDTFGDLTEARFSIKKHQANNIIRVLGVAQALEDITTQEFKERPLRVLVPILETHGTNAVRETWTEAARHGNVTDTALLQAANFLGYAPPKELTDGTEQKKEEGKQTAQGGESVRVVERLRSIAAKDPVRARREAEDLVMAVEKLVAELTSAE